MPRSETRYLIIKHSSAPLTLFHRDFQHVFVALSVGRRNVYDIAHNYPDRYISDHVLTDCGGVFRSYSVAFVAVFSHVYVSDGGLLSAVNCMFCPGL